jgi:hypothetical protein
MNSTNAGGKADPSHAIANRKNKKAENDRNIAEAIATLQRTGQEVNVTAVARSAGVHPATIRNRPELLAEVQSIRTEQWQRPQTRHATTRDTSTYKDVQARWKTAQAEVKQLRTERDRLRRQLHQALSGNSQIETHEDANEAARLSVALSNLKAEYTDLDERFGDLSIETNHAHELNRAYVAFYNRVPQEIRDQYPMTGPNP